MIYRYLLLVSIHREFLLSYIPIEHNYLGFTLLILRDSLRQQADAGSKVRWWRQQQSGLSSLMSSEDQDQLCTQAWETGYLILLLASLVLYLSALPAGPAPRRQQSTRPGASREYCWRKKEPIQPPLPSQLFCLVLLLGELVLIMSRSKILFEDGKKFYFIYGVS